MHETTQVTAYRTPLAAAASPASVVILSGEQMQSAPLPTLDDKLRLVPGLETFRRSSSLVANPTSQGLSLRGLGSTASSRTLFVTSDIPLNDAFGGWIHWEELPELSIRSVEVVRGGASDLYGSSAIGGVVNLLLVEPANNSFSLQSSYASLNTWDEAAMLTGKRGRWAGLATGGLLRTDGYILIAPDMRGPVDVPSNVHAQNGLVDLERQSGNDPSRQTRVFLHGSVFNEARGNGTPIQTNGTRIWRYTAGVDWPISGGNLALRVYGSTEHYRQSFSAIAANRGSEALTRTLESPADELGAVAHWSQPIGHSVIILAGADTHDVRARDTEVSYSRGLASSVLDTSTRQRQTGAYGEALWTPHQWTLSASARVDHFSNFDALTTLYAVPRSDPLPPATALPTLGETVFNPRLGIARRVTEYLSLTASAFRAYRAPTAYELYRTGQVGQEITLANPLLRSEHATGWEAGTVLSLSKANLRGSYFFTQVNRPITALTLRSTPTLITKQRENLGQIESRGVAVDFETQPRPWVMLAGGYQFANATVTKFTPVPPQPSLVGNWIPQVAQNMATAQVRLTQKKLGALSVQGRISGRQFDDDANAYLLHGYFRLDTTATHDFGRHLEVFASAENLFDRAIQIGKTPNLTLGSPLLGRFGIRLSMAQ